MKKINLLNVRNSCRLFMVRTNPYWPFSILNKAPYKLALQFFINRCSSFPAIKSVYLQPGFDNRYVPGISDIDLIVVIQNRLLFEKETAFLREFWQEYERVRKIFPMLTHIYILNEDQLKVWTRFRIEGYESIRWKLVYGEVTLQGNYTQDPKRILVDSINKALLTYRSIINFYESDYPSPEVMSRFLERAMFKVINYSGYLKPKNGTYKGGPDRLDILCTIIKSIDEQVLQFTPVNKGDKFSSIDTKGLINDSMREEYFKDELASCPGEIECILMAQESYSPYKKNPVVFVVLKDGLGDADIRKCAAITRKFFKDKPLTPFIVTYSMFKYMLRYYDVTAYVSLVKARKILFGRDIVKEIDPPDKYFFTKGLIDQAIDILSLPQSYMITSNPVSQWYNSWGYEFIDIIEWLLFLKLYFEKDLILTSLDELLAAYKKYYPDSYKDIKEIVRENPSKYDKTLEKGKIVFIKKIVKDIEDYISSWKM